MHPLGSVVTPPVAAQLYPNMRAAAPLPIITSIMSAVNVRSPAQILRPTRQDMHMIPVPVEQVCMYYLGYHRYLIAPKYRNDRFPGFLKKITTVTFPNMQISKGIGSSTVPT